MSSIHFQGVKNDGNLKEKSWSFTKGSNYRTLTRKSLVFLMSGPSRGSVRAYGRWTMPGFVFMAEVIIIWSKTWGTDFNKVKFLFLFFFSRGNLCLSVYSVEHFVSLSVLGCQDHKNTTWKRVSRRYPMWVSRSCFFRAKNRLVNLSCATCGFL